MNKKSSLKAKCPYCGELYISKKLHKHVSARHSAAMKSKLQKSKPEVININSKPKETIDYIFEDVLITSRFKKSASLNNGKQINTRTPNVKNDSPFVFQVISNMTDCTLLNLSKQIHVEVKDLINLVYNKTNTRPLENEVIDKEILIKLLSYIIRMHKKQLLKREKPIKTIKAKSIEKKEKRKKAKSNRNKKGKSIRAILIGHPKY